MRNSAPFFAGQFRLTGCQTAESACVAPAAGILAFGCCLSVWAPFFFLAAIFLAFFLLKLRFIDF